MARSFIPDQQYNPEWQANVSASTQLAQGISLSKFIYGTNTPQTVDHITENITDENRYKLAKQYMMHATAFLSCRVNPFHRHRVKVAEGYYRIPDKTKVYDVDSILYLRNKGRAVVYEIYGEDGEVDNLKSFDLALHFSTQKFGGLPPEKTILSYDHFNPNNELHSQVTLIMPEIEDGWNVRYSINENLVETKYNGYTLATGELIEVLPEEFTETVLYGS